MNPSPLQNHPQYQTQKSLGTGGFATVWLAWDKQRSIPVAVKLFSMRDREGLRLFRKEYEKTKQLSHPNIIKLIDFEENEDGACIIMPYYKRGTLQDRIGEITEEESWRLIRDIGRALAYLHDQQPPLLHNDLKPDNFLVSDDGRYILSDFGISVELSQRLLSATGSDLKNSTWVGVGPSAYKAPETFNYRDHKGSTPVMSSEIWAFGACLYQLITGETPFLERGGQVQLEEFMDRGLEVEQLVNPLPSSFSPKLSQLIFACLAFQTWQRPRASQLVAEAEKQLRLIYDNNQERIGMPEKKLRVLSFWAKLRWAGTLLTALLTGAGLMYFALSDNTKKASKTVPENTKKEIADFSQKNENQDKPSVKELNANEKAKHNSPSQPIPSERDKIILKNEAVSNSENQTEISEKVAEKPQDKLGKMMTKYLPDTGKTSLEREKQKEPVPTPEAKKSKEGLFKKIFSKDYGVKLASYSTYEKAKRYIDSLGLTGAIVFKNKSSTPSFLQMFYVIKPYPSLEQARQHCGISKFKKRCSVVSYNTTTQKEGYYLGSVSLVKDDSGQKKE